MQLLKPLLFVRARHSIIVVQGKTKTNCITKLKK